MGAIAWMYFVDYDPNVNRALETLRQAEFRAGRYHPATPFPAVPGRPPPETSGAVHPSISLACADAGAAGTRSILDINRIGTSPGAGTASPLDVEQQELFFGTRQPTRQQIELKPRFLDALERGHGIYLSAFSDGAPRWLCFAGISYD